MLENEALLAVLRKVTETEAANWQNRNLALATDTSMSKDPISQMKEQAVNAGRITALQGLEGVLRRAVEK